MLNINISGTPRQAFIAHASRFAYTPISIIIRDETLFIEGLSIQDASSLLAYFAFPVWEKQRLYALISKVYLRIDKVKKEQLAAIAQMLAEEDVSNDCLYQGLRRTETLAAAFNEELKRGPLNFNGFCCFRLPGYKEYLLGLLIQAEDDLLAAEENNKYLELLRNSLSSGHSEVALFFSPGDICQIWQKDGDGLRQLEGGHIRGVEWLLLANLICLDPANIFLYNSLYAGKGLLEMLESVFGEKISYNDENLQIKTSQPPMHPY